VHSKILFLAQSVNSFGVQYKFLDAKQKGRGMQGKGMAAAWQGCDRMCGKVLFGTLLAHFFGPVILVSFW